MKLKRKVLELRAGRWFLGAAFILVLPLAGCSDGQDSQESGAPSGSKQDVEASGVEQRAKSLAAIQSLLDTQTAAWNRGDIPAFMVGYWNSPELRFSSGATINRGWQGTLERYLTSYPDRATMGQLRFEDREIEVFSSDHALAFGRYILDREDDQLTGLFTLHLQRFSSEETEDDYAAADGWRIVSDHTSSAEE